MSDIRSKLNWLLNDELPLLERDGVLDSDAVGRIRDYHKKDLAERNSIQIAMVLLAVLGALLIGSGVILLIAHNWDMFPRQHRVAIALLPLICCGPCGLLILKRNKGPIFCEPFALFTGVAIVLAISLTSQIYNIDGRFSDLMRVVLGLCLPLIWIFRSTALLTATVLFLPSLAVRYSSQPDEYLWWLLLNLVMDWAYAAVIAWRMKMLVADTTDNASATEKAAVPVGRHASWLRIVMVYLLLSVFWHICCAGHNRECFVTLIVLSTTMVWWGLSLHRTKKVFFNPSLWCGYICLLITLAILVAYPWHKGGVSILSYSTSATFICWLVLASVIIRSLERRYDGIVALVSCLLLFCVPMLFPAPGCRYIVLLYWAILGIGVLVAALRRRDITLSLGGIGVLFVLAINRFVSNDMDMLYRSLVFIVLGIITLVVTWRVVRYCNKAQGGQE